MYLILKVPSHEIIVWNIVKNITELHICLLSVSSAC